MLDTHALIWALEGSVRLSKPARSAIENPRNEVLVSAASAWEIAIKKAMGWLFVPNDLIDAEAERLQRLPNHHSDPFDRMLIAHALEEQCAIVSKDAQIARCAVETLW